MEGSCYVRMFGCPHISGYELVRVKSDMVLEWCQQVAGKEYMVNGKLEGKDIGETRAPVNFGITSISDMMW